MIDKFRHSGDYQIGLGRLDSGVPLRSSLATPGTGVLAA